ncbi:MAG: cytochrome oxidase subunit III [Ardenticatenaceae bacterium]
MSKERQRFEYLCQIWGWVLFIISALFFMAASWRSGDMVSFLGGLFFLIACFVFLLPYVVKE